MLFIVRFTDKPDSLAIRQKYIQDHIAWLDKNRSQVLTGGALRETPESNPVGAMWIVEAENIEEVHEIYKSDPFWVNGLRDKIEVLIWSKAFDEKTMI